MAVNKSEKNGSGAAELAVKLQVNYTWKGFSLIAAAVSAIIEILLLMGLTVHWRAVRVDLISPLKPHIGMPWDKFVIEKDDENRMHCPATLKEKNEKQTNSTRCYGLFTDVMDGLITKGVIERYDSSTNPELASLNLTEYGCERSKGEHTTARLVGIATEKIPAQVGLRSKLFWDPHSPSYTKLGLRYLQDEGTIYVEKTGLYFVSLQLKTKLVTASRGNETDNIIKHSVHQISNGTETVILENVRTVCRMSTEDAESTSVLVAIFRLEYGDRLYAATSHPQNIAPDPHNNYFSVYII